MEKRKAKRGLTALLITSIVFIIIGTIYILVGSFVGAQSVEGDPVIFKGVFCGLGAIFLIVGVICLGLEISKIIRCNRLINSGQYIIAEITEVAMNYAVSVNRRHPYVVRCRYQDMYGNIHTFRSRNLNFDPAPFFKDQVVKVYVEGENFKHYYVDIDGVLPEVIRH